MATKQKQGSKGNKKAGRMKAKCEKYKQNKTREKNKVLKIVRHLKSHPNNMQAVVRMNELQAIISAR